MADALSRHQINVSTHDSTIHSVDSSPTEHIKRLSFALNRFTNQIEIVKSNRNSVVSQITFSDHQNHRIESENETELIKNLRTSISDKHLNAIFSTEETFYSIKKIISDTFGNTKFVFTTKKGRKCIRFDQIIGYSSENS